MLREFKEIEIGKDHILLEYNTGEVKRYDFPGIEIDFDPKKVGNTTYFSPKTNNTLHLGENRLLLNGDNGKVICIEIPKEMKFYVAKSLKYGVEFKLSYRQHLKWKYDKRHVRIEFFNCNPETLKEFSHELNSLYRLVSLNHGKGLENRPFIIFTEKEGRLYYRVFKNEKRVMWGKL